MSTTSVLIRLILSLYFHPTLLYTCTSHVFAGSNLTVLRKCRRMHRQCVPGSGLFPHERELGFEASLDVLSFDRFFASLASQSHLEVRKSLLFLYYFNRLEPSDKSSKLEMAAVVEWFGGVSPAPRVSFRTLTNDSSNSFTCSFTIRLIFGH